MSLPEPELSRALAAIFQYIDDPIVAFRLRVSLTRSVTRVSKANRKVILEAANKIPRAQGILLRRIYA